ncbi:MAG: energy transducer TonB [Candidatus Binatia bacterium]
MDRQAGLKKRQPVQQHAQSQTPAAPERQEIPKLEARPIATPVASDGVAAASDQSKLCENYSFVLRLGSARTVNDCHFEYLTDRSFDELRTGSEHGRSVLGDFSHTLQTHDVAVWDAGSAGSTTPAGDAGEGFGDAGGTKGTGGGRGYGNENGTGGGGVGVSLVGVRYAHNPKPEYPDNARSEGHEGTVVLRVLVDEEGRSKSLEVNRSSGHEALDKAAVETVRRWRFHAARYGDKRVENWVKIPIVFRLADLQD